MHGGRESEALVFARRLIDGLGASDVDVVVTNVSGCGAAMKEYGQWLRDDPVYAERAMEFSRRVRDVSEALMEVGPSAERHPLRVRAVYHDACHLLHGQSVADQPRQLLRQIPGLDLIEMLAERSICCGSAGTYNLLEPDPAAELGARKARNAIEADADVLVAGNPGCLLQIEASLRKLGDPLPTAHLIEVLDASIRGEQIVV
jgi:glycolate oxidase iron-sulfur subunit